MEVKKCHKIKWEFTCLNSYHKAVNKMPQCWMRINKTLYYNCKFCSVIDYTYCEIKAPIFPEPFFPRDFIYMFQPPFIKANFSFTPFNYLVMLNFHVQNKSAVIWLKMCQLYFRELLDFWSTVPFEEKTKCTKNITKFCISSENTVWLSSSIFYFKLQVIYKSYRQVLTSAPFKAGNSWLVQTCYTSQKYNTKKYNILTGSF
jgi:hypothetical protein